MSFDSKGAGVRGSVRVVPAFRPIAAPWEAIFRGDGRVCAGILGAEA
jgi:hypothetical protein